MTTKTYLVVGPFRVPESGCCATCGADGAIIALACVGQGFLIKPNHGLPFFSIPRADGWFCEHCAPKPDLLPDDEAQGALL